MRNCSNKNGRGKCEKKNIVDLLNEEKAWQPYEKNKKKVKKDIDNNDITWTREALLKLIYIEKKKCGKTKFC